MRALLACLILALPIGAQDKPRWLKGSITLETSSTAEPSEVLRVFIDKPGESDVKLWNGTPIAGTYRIAGNVITFSPRFPFEPNLGIRAITNHSGSLKELQLASEAFTIPKPTQEKPTTVEAVFPTSAKLPENALRMYVHFSAPMKQGLGQKHIQLTCDGKVVVEPYLHVEQELWSADGKRLTILFDPARVKRGLKPREEAGPILVEGKKHTLTIDAAWPDANGFPLKEKFSYSFEVGPPDETPIDPAKWTIAPPDGGILNVTFEKPLDKALSERLIWVVDPNGKRMELLSAAQHDQKGIQLVSFVGRVTFPPGKYKLVIDTRLEDVCGNRVGEAFEVDEFKPVTRVVVGKTLELAFIVK